MGGNHHVMIFLSKKNHLKDGLTYTKLWQSSSHWGAEQCVFQYLYHHLPHNLLPFVKSCDFKSSALCTGKGPPKKTSEQGQQFSPCCLQHMNRQMYVCMKGSFLDEWPPQSLCYKCNSAYIWKQGKWGGGGDLVHVTQFTLAVIWHLAANPSYYPRMAGSGNWTILSLNAV